MIYNGLSTENGKCVYEKGDSTIIGYSAYNTTVTDNAYVGYMYGTPGSNSYDETHANIKDSTLKSFIDSWYEKYLLSYTDYIEDEPYCNDRTTIVGGDNNYLSSDYGNLGYGKNLTAYKGISRAGYHSLVTTPELECENPNDRFTVSETNGNGKLKYPIATITMDELVYAGMTGGAGKKGASAATNNNYFLNDGKNFWTITPTLFYTNNYAYVGRSVNNLIHNNYVGEYTNGVRPVITLKKDTIFLSGNGTNNDPYKVTNETSKKLNSVVKVGDYITMTPSVFSYTITEDMTGCTETSNTSTLCSKTQKINPYELKLWRVLKINDDNTIEAISDNISTASVFMYGLKGYMNWVGTYNTVARQYYNLEYTLNPNDPNTPKIAFREMGYYDQTEYLTDASKIVYNSNIKKTADNSGEKDGLGDVSYIRDVETVKSVYGTLDAYTIAGSKKIYVLAARIVQLQVNGGIYWQGRSINNGAPGEYMQYWTSSNGITTEFKRGSSVRPIITFKNNLNALGDGTKEKPYVLGS